MSRSEQVPLSQSIDRFIRSELAQRGDEAAAIDIRELHCKKHGRFFRVDLPSGAPRRLFVKQRDHGAYQAEGLQPEFEALRRITAKVEATPLRETIPQPFALDLERNILAVALVPGRDPMRKLYLAAITGVGLASAKRWLAASGAWLGQFQVATATGAAIDLEAELARAQGQLEALRLLGPRHVEALANLLEEPEPARLPEVEVHGDFALRNLLVSGDRDVHVIDWEHAVPGHALVDVCEFMSNLMLPARYLAGPRNLVELSRAFAGAWWAAVDGALEIDPGATMRAAAAGAIARMSAHEQTGVGGTVWRRVFGATAEAVLQLDFTAQASGGNTQATSQRLRTTATQR